jgi:hypothetical protein
MPMAHAANNLGIRQCHMRSAIQHHKIVAGTVHFAKPQWHQRAVPASDFVGSGFTRGPLLPQAETSKQKANAANTIFIEYLFMQKV